MVSIPPDVISGDLSWECHYWILQYLQPEVGKLFRRRDRGSRH